VLNDPCWPFIDRFGWSGVCVEPVPHIFERLAANYADLPQVQLVQAAISRSKRTFWYVENADFVTAQVGSLDRTRVVTALVNVGLVPGIEVHYPTAQPPTAPVDATRRPGTIASLDVECLTFAELAQRCGLDRIDLVNIDVEGFDWEVLEMIDLDRHQVSVAIVETGDNADEATMEQHLISHGFNLRAHFGIFSTVWARSVPATSPA